MTKQIKVIFGEKKSQIEKKNVSRFTKWLLKEKKMFEKLTVLTKKWMPWRFRGSITYTIIRGVLQSRNIDK